MVLKTQRSHFLFLRLALLFLGAWLAAFSTYAHTRGTLAGAGGIGGLLARMDRNGSAFYHADGNGNVTLMVDGSGREMAWYLYDPYGNLLAMRGPLAEVNTYRFSSKELDVQSGLYYYGFRYYEPNFQRWLNQDPLQESGGINLYQFVGNDPVNYVDPFGLSLFDDFGDWDLDTLQKGKEFFTGKPGDMRINDGYDGYRAGTGSITSLTDGNGNEVWSGDVMFELGTMLPFALLGPEREGAELAAGAMKCKRTAQLAKATDAAESGALRIAPYGELSGDIAGQAHHLNQTAAFRDVIPRSQGLSIELQGNILTDAGAPHTLAHQSLEGFWNTFRGTEIVPSNLQYTRALQQSLRAAGLPETQVQQAVRAAIRERVDFGLLGGMEVPRVPGPIRNLAQ